MSPQPLHIYIHATERPDKPALRRAATDLVVTFGELEAGSNRIAHLLRGLGLSSGDHMALLMENQPSFLQVCWASQRSGLFNTPISTRLTVDEAAYIARDCGAKAFITSRAMSEVAAELLHQLPDHVVKLMVDGAIEGYHAFGIACCRVSTDTYFG